MELKAIVRAFVEPFGNRPCDVWRIAKQGDVFCVFLQSNKPAVLKSPQKGSNLGFQVTQREIATFWKENRTLYVRHHFGSDDLRWLKTGGDSYNIAKGLADLFLRICNNPF